MKKISLFITLLLLSSTLDARDNPFEPTQAYEEEQARMMEMDENYPDEFQNQEQIYIKSIQDKMKKKEANSINKDMAKKPKKDTAITEAKIKKLINQAQKNTVKETKKIVKEALENKEPEEVVFVKTRTDVSYEKEILPFIKIEYTNEKFQIFSKYKVFKKFTLPNKNKIILDFYANENFYTKREELTSSNFTKITVGNHKKDKFFRVVLELSHTPQNYEVTYNEKEVTIYKLDQM